MTRLLLATTDEGWEARVRASFDGTLNGELRSWGTEADGVGDADGMLAAIEGHDARVVALGPGLSADEALTAAARLDHDRPDLCVLIVAEPTPDLYRQALRVGVRDIVDPAADLAEVRAAFDAALQTAGRRTVSMVPAAETDTGRTIAVVSPKGGAGKTAIGSAISAWMSGSYTSACCSNESSILSESSRSTMSLSWYESSMSW